MVAEMEKKTAPPQIATSDKAFRLAEQWINSMSKSADDEPAEVETESRPLSLFRRGLGAKDSRMTKSMRFNDSIDRKLMSNLEAGKSKAAKENEDCSVIANNTVDADDSDNDLESRQAAEMRLLRSVLVLASAALNKNENSSGKGNPRMGWQCISRLP